LLLFTKGMAISRMSISGDISATKPSTIIILFTNNIKFFGKVILLFFVHLKISVNNTEIFIFLREVDR